jgi:hypothetical protein
VFPFPVGTGGDHGMSADHDSPERFDRGRQGSDRGLEVTAFAAGHSHRDHDASTGPDHVRSVADETGGSPRLDMEPEPVTAPGDDAAP